MPARDLVDLVYHATRSQLKVLERRASPVDSQVPDDGLTIRRRAFYELESLLDILGGDQRSET